MKIFIVGPTNSGKSTLAHYISGIVKCPVVSAGFYMKENYKQGDEEDKETYTRRITNIALEFLKKDHGFFLNKIKDVLKPLAEPVIIEGIRNSRDFTALFNPIEDAVIFINTASNTKDEYPIFEIKGLQIISDMLMYFNMIKRVNVFHYSISAPTVEHSISKHLYDYIHSINQS